MMTVSTNGRSTPWNTGGSCRSLMIPTGTSSMPARKLNDGLMRHVDVGLFELELAGLFQPFDKRVFELELADEPQAVGKAVAEEQHEAMKVERGIAVGAIDGRVQVHLHVAGDRARSAAGRRMPFALPPEPPVRGRRRRPGRCTCFDVLMFRF